MNSKINGTDKRGFLFYEMNLTVKKWIPMKICKTTGVRTDLSFKVYLSMVKSWDRLFKELGYDQLLWTKHP